MRGAALAFVPALVFALLVSPALCAQPVTDEAGALTIDYQKKEAFRDRARRAVLHVYVEGNVLPGFDPSFPPTRTGAATFVRLPTGEERLVTAASLVDEAARITVIRRQGQQSAARVDKLVAEDTLALLTLSDRAALRDITALPLSAEEAPLPTGRTLFTLDNLASDLEVLLWGKVAGPGPPPLTHLRIVGIERNAGHPLLTAKGEVAGFCFRAYTPTDRRCFAVPASTFAGSGKSPTPAP